MWLNSATQIPYVAVGALQLRADLGQWITGTHPSLCDNPNQDPAWVGQFQRTLLGYLSGEQPDVYHGPRYTVPEVGTFGFTDWDRGTTGRNEDFADMFMNWTYHTFDYRGTSFNAGWNRYYWMDNHMLDWID